MAKRYAPLQPGRKWFKTAVCKIVLVVLGRAFQAGARHDPDIRREVEAFPEGFILVMNVLPFGPRMALEKHNGKLKYRGSRYAQGDLVINFKNLECAFMVLTPQIGATQAFAERRLTVIGDLGYAMVFTRCLNMLLAHLYPRFVCKRLVKRVPPMPLKKQWIKLKINLLGIPFGL